MAGRSPDDSKFTAEPLGFQPEVNTPNQAVLRRGRESMLDLDVANSKVELGEWQYLMNQLELDLAVDTDEFEGDLKEVKQVVRTLGDELRNNNLSVETLEDHLMLWLNKTEYFECIIGLRRVNGNKGNVDNDELKKEAIQFIFYALQIAAFRLSPTLYDRCNKIKKPGTMTRKEFFAICEELEGPKDHRNKRARLMTQILLP